MPRAGIDEPGEFSWARIQHLYHPDAVVHWQRAESPNGSTRRRMPRALFGLE
jgi:hypothetical protein